MRTQGMPPAILLRAILNATTADQVTVPRQSLAAVLDKVAPEVPPPAYPNLLTVDQAAARLQISRYTLYKTAKRFPFTVKLSHRVLRFDEAKLAAWLAARYPEPTP